MSFAISLIVLGINAFCIYRRHKDARNNFIIAIVAITNTLSNVTSFLSIRVTTAQTSRGERAYWAFPIRRLSLFRS
ncbi:MAG: hypothetical protein ABSC87_06205 [Halobacteriota archaeon]